MTDYASVVEQLREQQRTIQQVIDGLLRLQQWNGNGHADLPAASLVEAADWIGSEEAARIMGVSPTTIRARVKVGLMRGKVVQEGKMRRLRVARQDVETYAALHPMAPGRAARVTPARSRKPTRSDGTSEPSGQAKLVLDTLRRTGPASLREVTERAQAAGFATRSAKPWTVVGQALVDLKRRGLVRRRGRAWTATGRIEGDPLEGGLNK